MLKQFDDAEKDSRAAANHLLLNWLSDDDARAHLYAELGDPPRVLKFQSRADVKERTWHDGDSSFRQNVYLLAAPSHVKAALQNKPPFSNAPYRALGSGTFMLGLDGLDHDDQRNFAYHCLERNDRIVQALANVAFKAAAALPLKQRSFDLVEL